MEKAEGIIKKLNLLPHPEGGYFKEIYRSSESIHKDSLPDRYKGDRNFSTSIYFLLVKNQRSLFHRLLSDEIWHFYDGSPIIIHCIDDNGYSSFKLGKETDAGEEYQHCIKAGTWFAAEIEDKNSYALIGCTVAPGFDFADFTLALRSEMSKLYPEFDELIIRFTKE